MRFMSLGLLVERDAPAIWRGPIIMKVVQQFLRDVEWGRLDYFIVDLPPGTGDAQLSLVQATHVAGAVIVTTPQEMAVGDALRGARMFERVGVPVLGIVENMSGFVDPEHAAGGSSSSPPAGADASPRSWAFRCWAASRSSPAWPSWPTPGSRSSMRSPRARPRWRSERVAEELRRKTAGRTHGAARSCAGEPRALITLLTDFGTADSYVAEVKGALLSAAPQATLVDLTHAVPPGDLRAAAYLLGRTWHRFPGGHGPPRGGGPRRRHRARRARASAPHGHWFVGPDNGLFTPVLRDAAVEIVILPIPPTARADLPRPRPLRARGGGAGRGGAAGGAGTAVRRAFPTGWPTGSRTTRASRWSGEVVYVDRFGTLVTNLTPELVPAYAVIEVEGLEVGPLRRTFGDVPTGGLLAYLGSGGQVEIAVRDGSAARRLGMGVGGRIRVRLG